MWEHLQGKLSRFPKPVRSQRHLCSHPRYILFTPRCVGKSTSKLWFCELHGFGSRACYHQPSTWPCSPTHGRKVLSSLQPMPVAWLTSKVSRKRAPKPDTFCEIEFARKESLPTPGSSADLPPSVPDVLGDPSPEPDRPDMRVIAHTPTPTLRPPKPRLNW
jgi:hypothetical protein